MDYDDIFAAYYTQYRAEAQIPDSTDDEYITGIALANEAINRWANYDATYWKELWTTHQTNNTGDQTVTTADTTYTLATNMREIGGDIKILNSDSNVQKRYPLIEPHEVQFRNPESTFAYVTGTPGTQTLHLNPAPDASLNGMSIEFDYYKKPTELTTGASTTEMANPYFIVHHMLGNRFRASRNWSAYQSAKRDSEDALKIMQMDNNSGTWSNPWKLADYSGGSFGA